MSVTRDVDGGHVFCIAEPVIAPQIHSRATELLGVLVVDDDELTSDLMAIAVRSFGHRCRVAPDGDAALRAIAEERPDVVISDLQMPGMSGTELCRRVRIVDAAISRVYFIILSGSDDPHQIDAGSAAGVDDFQHKPVDLDKLEASLAAARDIWWRAPA